MTALKIQCLVLFAALQLISCRPFFYAGTVRFGAHSFLEEAEEYSRQERYEEAIEAYRNHIDQRLSVDRPEWENPYLYLLLIGDLYLQQGQVEKALESYEEAEQRKVDTALVSDRYRYVASWYEKKDQLQEAFDLLGKYRDRDPLLMDAVRDRLAREITRREDEKAQGVAP